VRLILSRSISDEHRTLGKLTVGFVTFATIERPWIPNPEGAGGMPRKSCVPLGEYLVRPHHSTNFPNTYALVSHENGVWYQPYEIPAGQEWGRSAILIHVGNIVTDVIGCIAIGKEHGTLQNQPAVIRSTQAMRELDKILNRHSHTLTIQQE
jgi:hypothetical protein